MDCGTGAPETRQRAAGVAVEVVVGFVFGGDAEDVGRVELEEVVHRRTRFTIFGKAAGTGEACGVARDADVVIGGH
jgi:hypothetical protein